MIQAPETETWKQIKECGMAVGMAVLCLYDFISDIFASQDNAHSEHKELHFLGYFGAGLLLASGVANMVMVCVIRKSHLEAFQELSKRMPFQWHLFRLLSSTSPEILNSFFAIAKASSTLPLSTSFELEVAAGTVKRFGLLAQLFEDIPQFTVQAMSVYLCLQHGWALSAGVLASLGGTLAMVLFKTITNFLALALKCQVSQVVLAEAAEEEHRQVKLFPDWTRACHLIIQALMVILNVLFLLNSGPIHFPHSKYFGHLDGRTIGYISLFISYVLAIALSLLLVLQCRDRLWHMLSDLDRSAALLALSSLHPCTLLLADPCLPKVAPCLWHLLFFPPLLRNITVGCLSLWGIWKDPFPVPENYCILLVVLNFLAIFQLILFVEDTEVEEVTEVSSITSLEHREIKKKKETRKLDELFGNLQKSKLADWPRLLEQCPTSFEKHKGISMAMDLRKAVDQRKSEAAAAAAKRILASGQNFETFVIQDGFIFLVSEFNISA